jgi:phosphoketolase
MATKKTNSEKKFKHEIPEETREHYKKARAEMREAIKGLLPEGFVEHHRTARREMQQLKRRKKKRNKSNVIARALVFFDRSNRLDVLEIASSGRTPSSQRHDLFNSCLFPQTSPTTKSHLRLPESLPQVDCSHY